MPLLNPAVRFNEPSGSTRGNCFDRDRPAPKVTSFSLKSVSLPLTRYKGTGDLPVLVHIVSQRARVLRLRRTQQPLAFNGLPYCLPPLGMESASCSIGFSKLNSPAHWYLCLRFSAHLAMDPVRLEAGMDSLFSFPVGLFHPLQHAGLSAHSGSPTIQAELCSVLPGARAHLSVIELHCDFAALGH